MSPPLRPVVLALVLAACHTSNPAPPDGGPAPDAGAPDGGSEAPDAGLAFPADFARCGCLPPLEHCDPRNPRSCVACLSDDDCAVPLRRCTGQNTCVECLADADCGSGRVCDLSRSACVSDCRARGVTCPTFQTCDTRTGLCADGCTSTADCAAPRPFCSAERGGTGQCFQCRTPADCPAFNPGCSRAGGFGACGAADSQDDCPAPLVFDGISRCQCDPANDRCGELSSTTPKCREDSFTHGHFCGCASDVDCAGGEHCDFGDFPFHAGIGVCVKGCADASGFASWSCEALGNTTGGGGLVCDASAGICGGCLTSADCAGTADRPTCIAAGTGYLGHGGVCGCATNDDCPAPLACDTSVVPTGRCVPRCNTPGGPNCEVQAALTGNLDATICSDSGRCGGCSTDAQCRNLYGAAKPACVGVVHGDDGFCGCTSDAQCGPGNVCNRIPDAFGHGVCAPRCDRTTSAPCTTISAANANLCHEDGFCAECLTNDDCAARIGKAKLCETAVGTCRECLVASDCRAGAPGCVPALGCGACLADADCLHGATCDASTRTCRFPCTRDFGAEGDGTACPEAQPFCNMTKGLCEECHELADCTAPSRSKSCHPTTHQCVYGR